VIIMGDRPRIRSSIEAKALGMIAAILISCVAGPACAQLDARWKFDREAVGHGEEAFRATCSFCHGSDARGSQRAPDLLHSELVNKDDKGELIGPVVIGGRTDKGMPAFPQMADKIADIAAFLHSSIIKVGSRYGYQSQISLTGDAGAGKRLFNGSLGCSTCHSAAGDLAGIAKKYTPEKLQGAFVYPGPTILAYLGINMRAVSKPTVTITVTRKNADTVSGVAVYIGEYDLALRDSKGGYRSFQRSQALKIEVQDPMEAHRHLIGTYSDADMHNLLAYLLEFK
jgi:cytochrome c oxidase cbb3-type subunit 3